MIVFVKNFVQNCDCLLIFATVYVQVISSVTGNKQCVSNIADANVLQFVLLVLYMLPQCEFIAD